MNKLIFLVGLPACGKSTYANENLSKDCEILSSDLLRKELFGDERIQKDSKLVFSTLFKRAQDFLRAGKNVVIDATNVDLLEREQAMQHFKDFNVKRIAIVFDVPIETCVTRDLGRNRTVGEYVIKRYAKKFVLPTKSEGFDEIIFIR